jgi:hypothetical protein
VTSRAGRLRTGAALAVAAALAGVGCGEGPPTRDVRATIVDGEGRPVPGAVFVAVARDAGGPFAALVARAGSAGEVPDEAREPAQIAWRRDARLTLAALAPGFRPTVRFRDDGRVRADGAVLTLERREDPSEAWSPALARLPWPLPGNPADPAGPVPPADDPARERLRELLEEAARARREVPEEPSAAEKTLLDAVLGQNPEKGLQAGGRSGRS